ncbi:MAG: hypothetical protein AB1393_01775 [Candidatus Edwardsbacteria bacterium]
MIKLHFNFKDVFRAARLAFSPKKLWIQFCGLFLGSIFYAIFAYLTLMAEGQGIVEIWGSYHWLPLLPLEQVLGFAWYSWILFIIGCLLFLITTLFANTLVCKIAFEQLKGNEFFEIKESMKFLKENWKAVIGAPFTIFLFTFFILICGFILGLWGKIPYVGEISVVLLTIPIFFVCVFIVFLLIVLGFSLKLSPAIVATTKSDTFDTVFESFSTVTSQPWRLVLYEFLLGAIAWLGLVILSTASRWALWIAKAELGWNVLMGDKLLGIIDKALVYLPPLKEFCLRLCPQLSPSEPCAFLEGIGLGLTPSGLGIPLSGWGEFCAFLLGIFLWLIVLTVLSYFFAIGSVGQTLIYTILVKMKDEKNLLEKKEEEEKPFEEIKPAEEKKEEEKKEEEKKEEEKKE